MLTEYKGDEDELEEEYTSWNKHLEEEWHDSTSDCIVCFSLGASIQTTSYTKQCTAEIRLKISYLWDICIKKCL